MTYLRQSLSVELSATSNYGDPEINPRLFADLTEQVSGYQVFKLVVPPDESRTVDLSLFSAIDTVFIQSNSRREGEAPYINLSCVDDATNNIEHRIYHGRRVILNDIAPGSDLTFSSSSADMDVSAQLIVLVCGTLNEA